MFYFDLSIDLSNSDKKFKKQFILLPDPESPKGALNPVRSSELKPDLSSAGIWKGWRTKSETAPGRCLFRSIRSSGSGFDRPVKDPKHTKKETFLWFVIKKSIRFKIQLC